jgi:N-acyl-D-amino-acid deacylase
VGFRDVPLRGADLERARRLVREGLEQGAVGFSTGSKYYPGPWADTEELVELCRTVQAAGAVYMCEPRSANLERAHGGHGVREAVEVARRTAVRLHFAHYRTSPATAGQLDRLMEFIDPARADGLDVTFDVYPYPAGSSIPVSLLPSDAQEGGPDAILARLRDAAERRRIADYLDRDGSLPMADVLFSYLPRHPELEGMSLADVARRQGQGMGETLCQLLLDAELKIGYLGAPPQSLALWRQVSRDCMTLLSRPDYMVCSDMTPAGSFPHPRSYGAFPRFLGRLRREFGGHARGDDPADDGRSGPALRPHPARPARARVLRRPRRVRPGARHRQRDVRRPATVPYGHSVCGGQRPAGRRPGALHGRLGRPRRTLSSP